MQRPTRRQFVLSATTSSALAVAGVYGLSRRGQAVSVDVQSLDVKDQQLSRTDAPETLPLRVTGEYTIDANVTPSKIQIRPSVNVVDSSMAAHEYSTVEQSLGSDVLSGEFDFEVNLLALYSLREAFPATEGESSDFELELRLQAIVIGPGGAEIGSAEVSDGFRLRLTHESATASIGISAEAQLRD